MRRSAPPKLLYDSSISELVFDCGASWKKLLETSLTLNMVLEEMIDNVSNHYQEASRLWGNKGRIHWTLRLVNFDQ